MLYIEIEILHRGTIEHIDNVLNHPPMRKRTAFAAKSSPHGITGEC